MTISSVGLDQSVGSSGSRSTIRQAHQDFDQLFQSLQAGNLNAAQQAYNSFQQIQTGLANSATSSSSAVGAANPTATTNPVTSDWSALGQALQSGSLSSAQSALGQLQQDANAAWQSHLQQETQNAQSVYALMQSVQGTSPAVSTQSINGSTTANPVQNDLNSLTQALQSGDTAGAQKLLAQLEQDLQSAGQASGQNYGGHHHHHHHSDSSGLNNPSAPATSTPATSTPITSTGSAGSIGATSSSG